MAKSARPETFGELKKAGYTYQSVKDELRKNLIEKLKSKETVFKGILGYDKTVIPAVENALLAGHTINLLGLRGQAKTRIARQMVDLLDEWIPVVAGSEINDDPFKPISTYARELLAEKGDQTPIEWLHRSERFNEKLATPDVTVADLIGDIDPIKAATLKVSYADYRAIHFGLIPRSNRCIFVINELPDLQARIQVSLFNILQEGDVQIRGFKLRLPLDIQFVFTANPEDYTNRGSIVTPLKDRIQSQILTHYPESIEHARQITEQEAKLSNRSIEVSDLIKNTIEYIAFEARVSEYVDAKSGVSARLTISAYENLNGQVERRTLINNEKNPAARFTDLYMIIPAINGKVELVYEGEQEGPKEIAQHLIGRAIRTSFLNYFPDPERIKKKKEPNPYTSIIEWFTENDLELYVDDTAVEYRKKIDTIKGIHEVVKKYMGKLPDNEKYIAAELLLFGLSEFSQISKNVIDSSVLFKDLFGMYRVN
jgi:magnesium chelatase subunit I